MATEQRLTSVIGRRVASISSVFCATALLLILSPLWIPFAFTVDRIVGGKSSVLRTLSFAFVFLVCDIAGVLSATVLYLIRGGFVRSGKGRERFLEHNFRLQCLWAELLLAAATRIFGFRISVEGEALIGDQPFLLLLRHASLADTLIPATLLQKPHALRFRYILKRELLWEPCLDIVGNRLANHFIERHSDNTRAQLDAIARLVAETEGREGVLIYPEGTRFTVTMRDRIRTRLAEGDDAVLGKLASELERVLPPRSAGVIAMLNANPGLDVVICAHHGFENAARLTDLRRGALVGQKIRVRFFRIAYDDLPSEREDQERWLYDWWRQIDRWLAEATNPQPTQS